MAIKVPDLVAGTRFGRLTVLSRAANGVRGRSRYMCSCSCGTKKVVGRAGLMRTTDPTRSCGCLQREATHRHSTKLHRTSKMLWGTDLEEMWDV